jgi:hypothetical protein
MFDSLVFSIVTTFWEIFSGIEIPNDRHRLTEQAHAKGIGRHSPKEIEAMGLKDLAAISTFLGNKKFMFGDTATELDSVVFGFMCIILYCHFFTFKEKVEKTMPNLVCHTELMIKKYWPDWKDCIYKQ